MSKIVYYTDENITFEYERFPDFVAVHCTVPVWKPSVLRNAYKVFGQFTLDVLSWGITKMVSFSPNPKFAHIFGGHTIKAFIYEGRKIEVVVWELK